MPLTPGRRGRLVATLLPLLLCAVVAEAGAAKATERKTAPITLTTMSAVATGNILWASRTRKEMRYPPAIRPATATTAGSTTGTSPLVTGRMGWRHALHLMTFHHTCDRPPPSRRL